MRIAIDIRDAGGEKTGKGWYTFHIVRNLLKLDKRNQYILYAKNGIPGFEEFKNVELKVIEAKSIFWHTKTARDIKKQNVDLFFAPTSYIIPTLLPKSIRKIITVHDLVAFKFPNKHNKKAVFIEKLFLKRALKKAEHVCAVSANTKKDIIDKFKCPANKISVVYCGADDNFKPVDKEILMKFAKKTKTPPKFFLAVGTLEPRKNYVNLIKAFSYVSEKYPFFHLIIVGKNGWQYEEIYEEIKKNYLQKKVHILGYLSGASLVNLYNLAEAFVFPSLYEGFGMPPLEAMKSGCPVIASHTSSIPEVVGDAGIMIDPKNPESIAAGMFKLIKNPQFRNGYKEKGIHQAQKFSWSMSAQKLFEIFKNNQA